jgi:predicted acyltransferase
VIDINAPQSSRLLSLDFLRGFIMVLLMLESTLLVEHLLHTSEDSVFHGFLLQFFHHPWNGLRFWDLIQPGFMFIAGTAMAYSLKSQESRGLTWMESFVKVLGRCWWLFFWGVLNYAVESDGTLSFELWNVLTQLSFTTLLAFVIFRWSYSVQILFCAGLLILTEILYRFTNIPGFDEPFTNFRNFGNFMDLVLMNKVNGDGWVAINAIPTAVHTIAGAMAGKYLIEGNKSTTPLIVTAIVAMLAGYTLHFAEITPIIKRIATSSFTLTSLGWCLLAMAFSYWWIDIRKHKKYLSFFTIVGMNSLFIYLFFEIVASRWFNGYVTTIVTNVLGWISIPESVALVYASIVIFSVEWYLCYFLYKKKVFIKI